MEIPRIPPEILLKIFQKLDNTFLQKNCTLVSKQFSELIRNDSKFSSNLTMSGNSRKFAEIAKVWPKMEFLNLNYGDELIVKYHFDEIEGEESEGEESEGEESEREENEGDLFSKQKFQKKVISIEIISKSMEIHHIQTLKGLKKSNFAKSLKLTFKNWTNMELYPSLMKQFSKLFPNIEYLQNTTENIDFFIGFEEILEKCSKFQSLKEIQIKMNDDNLTDLCFIAPKTNFNLLKKISFESLNDIEIFDFNFFEICLVKMPNLEEWMFNESGLQLYHTLLTTFLYKPNKALQPISILNIADVQMSK